MKLMLSYENLYKELARLLKPISGDTAPDAGIALLSALEVFYAVDIHLIVHELGGGGVINGSFRLIGVIVVAVLGGVNVAFLHRAILTSKSWIDDDVDTSAVTLWFLVGPAILFALVIAHTVLRHGHS